MKQKWWTRQFLSVLMALAILCSLAAPARAASGYTNFHSVSLAVGGSQVLTANLEDIGISDYYHSYYSFSARWDSQNPDIVSVENSYDFSTTITGRQMGTATVCAYIYGRQQNTQFDVYLGTVTWNVTVGNGVTGSEYVSLNTSALYLNSATPSGTLSVTSAFPALYGIRNVQWATSDQRVATVTQKSATVPSVATVDAYSTGTATVTAYVEVWDYQNNRSINTSVSCLVTVGTGTGTGELIISPTKLTMQPNAGEYQQLTVSTASQSSALYLYLDQVYWTSSNTGVVRFLTADTASATGRQVTLYGLSAGKATITATLALGSGVVYTATCEVTVGSMLDVKATVLLSEGSFTFSSTNAKTSISVVDQIEQAIRAYNPGLNVNSLAYVAFQNTVTDCGTLNVSPGIPVYAYTNRADSLSNLIFTPTSVGKAVFAFTAYSGWDNSASYTGTLTIDVERGSSSVDVLYTPARGQTQALDPNDFIAFWQKTYSRGALQDVTFGTPTSGSSVGGLYYGSTSVTGSSNLAFSASSAGTGYRLSEVSFIPSRSGSSYATGTLVIPFTAAGTGNSGTTRTTLQGNLYIAIPAGTVSAIRYPAATTALVPSDFTTVYRSAAGSSAASNMCIQFLDVPAKGSLYVNYNSTAVSSRGTLLTAKNVGTYTFYNTARTSTTNSISDVTYVPSSTSSGVETIRYAAYSTSGVLQYVGTIEFGYIADASVNYVSGIAGVTFRSVDFFGTGAPLEAGQYVTFGTPSSGKLYRNYVKGAGTSVTDTTHFSSSSGPQIYAISDVTYVPNANFVGTVTIPFTVYDANTTVGSGKVTIQVSNKSFVDAVDKTHWAYPFIYRLVAEGVVKGTDDTHFSPKKVVTNGEAIKMILLAVGYDDPGQGSGSAWAQPYIELAYQKGIISSTNVPSAETINRQTMVMLAAKAMGLSPSSSIKAGIDGPTDISGDAAGYIRAMYNAGIINGTVENGVNKFKPTSSLTREEMAKIVCLIMDYCDARG